MNPPAPFRTSRLLGVLLLLLLPPRTTVQAADPAPSAPLRPGDALLIRIDHLGGTLPAYREIVDADGMIEKPYLGFMHAAGKTPAD